MHVHRATEGSLRKDALHFGMSPICRPVGEKLFLTRAQ